MSRLLRFHLLRSIPAVLALLLGAVPAASEPELAPGAKLAELRVGATVYRDVEVRSVNARTVVILHRAGMASLRLRDLAPEWQARFGYDPAADADAERILAASPTKTVPTTSSADANRPTAATTDANNLEGLFERFGQPAALRAGVDLRPQFFQLELGVKNQGRRPSCAVFAIVSALEYQNAQLAGHPERFSEEYLIWATRQTVRRTTGPAAVSDTPASDDADEGFSLLEVVAALRGYGIPLQSSMPNTFGHAIAEISEPPRDVIEEARRHERVFIHLVPGRDNATRINNLVHILNSGRPVPIGLAWPHYRALRTGFLSQQQPLPERGHAVTLVGYLAPSHRLEDTVFVFKNSWGVNWGQGGYGTVTYEYLLKNLTSAVLLEVQRG